MITLLVHAQSYDRESAIWRVDESRSYVYKGSNRRAAITFALKKIKREFPEHGRYSVNIVATKSALKAKYEENSDDTYGKI